MQQDREGAIKGQQQQLDHVDQRRLKPPAPAEQALNCPRCDSLNTKFCYYNNYSQSQPRHFCKNCRRYWTRGGALRNVPVGGGCRKNKRPKQRISSEQQQQQQQQQSPSSLPKQNSPHVFYNLPHLANQLDLSAFPASQPAACSSAMFPDATTSCQLPSFSHHLPSLGSLQHLRNSFMGLDFNGVVRPEQGLQVGDQLGTFLQSSSVQLAPLSAAAASEGFRPRLDAFNEIDPIAKLALGLEESHMMDGHVLAGFQAEENQQPVERLRQSFMPIKVEQKSPSSTDWHGEQQPGFYEQTPESSFWNNAPTWPNLNPYSTSASPLL